MLRRVVVTGLGLVSPLGVGARTSWKRLIDGKCGVTAYRDIESLKSNPCQVAAYVPLGNKSDGGWNPREWVDPADQRRMAKFTQFALAATQEAFADAGWVPSTEEDFETTGVSVGSGIGSLDDAYDTSVAFQTRGYRQVSPLFVPRLLINLAAGHISLKYGLRGPNMAISTACTTGLHSIIDATRMIATSEANVMIAGGSEACIHPVSMAGFARARSLTISWNDQPQRASRPFDAQRSGFVMGEGAGILILEELSHAQDRGAKIYAEVKGYGLSGDAHHVTAPRSDGRGPYRAMQRAIRRAGLKPRDVGYVNAHATSTILGDRAENFAIRSLLLGGEGGDYHPRGCCSSSLDGEHLRHPEEINVSANKGAIGHLLGASGAVEAVFTILALHNGILPPTLNLEDPGGPSDSDPTIPDPYFDCNYVPGVAQDVGTDKLKVALTNSFGFGGTNASMCFTRVE